MTTLSGTGEAKRQIVHSLQILRAVAATLVLMRHATVHSRDFGFPGTFEVGQIGVDVFFVLSGVVIYLTSRNLEWHVFARRRVARIVPLYWLATLAAIIPILMRATDQYTWPNIVGAFLFIPVHDSIKTIWPPVMAGWTLNFEMYFYAICTLVLAFVPRRWFVPAVSLAILAGIGIGAPILIDQGARVVPAALIWLMPISLEFLAGFALAAMWEKDIRTPLWFNIALFAAACAWLTFFPDNHPYRFWRPFTWGIPAVAIVWALFASEEKLPFAQWKTGLLLGDASYAIYLAHPAALTIGFGIVERLGVPIPPLALIVLAAIACVVLGVLVHKIVEVRLVRWAGHALGLKRRARANSAQTAAAPIPTSASAN